MSTEAMTRLAAQIAASCLFMLLAVWLIAPHAPEQQPVPITTPFDAPQRVPAVLAITPAPESRIQLVSSGGLDVASSMADKSRIASTFLRDDLVGHDPLEIQEVVPEDLRAQFGQPMIKEAPGESLAKELRRQILAYPDEIRCDSFVRSSKRGALRARFTVNAGTPKVVSNDPSDNRVHARYLDQTYLEDEQHHVTAEFFFISGNTEHVRLEVVIQYYETTPHGHLLSYPIYLDPFYLTIPVR